MARSTRDYLSDIDLFLSGHVDGATVPAAPPTPALSTQVNIAGKGKRSIQQAQNLSRDSEAFVLEVVSVIDRHVDSAMRERRPVEASMTTIQGVDERRQMPDNSAFRRFCDIMDLAHCAADVNDVPTGDDLQRNIFRYGARPPFRASASSSVTNLRASVENLRALLIRHFAVAPVGMARLREPYFLLTAEWLVEYAGQSGVALVLQQTLPAGAGAGAGAGVAASSLPPGLVFSLNGLSAAESKREQFLYVGYVAVDLALVTATAGVPDVVL